VGEVKLSADVRIKDRNNVGLSETGKKREKKSEGQEPEVPENEGKIGRNVFCASQKFHRAAWTATPEQS
jgi:hypothetical protein